MKSIALLMLLLTALAQAEETSESFTIQIENTRQSIQGHYEYISISKLGKSPPLGAFEFLIAYDPEPLTFMEASPGGLFRAAGWQLLVCREVDPELTNKAKGTGYLLIQGSAEHPDSTTQGIEITDSTGSLVDLKFYVTNDRTWESLFTPIRFCWSSPDDNRLFSLESRKIYGMSEVRDYDWDQVTTYPFGTITGADCRQESPVHLSGPCESDAATASARPSVIFWNGGVDIAGYGWIDRSGDLNLNGINNEVADVRLYAYYFIYGIQVFDIALDGQVSASDINDDGLVLSVADMTRMVRMIAEGVAPALRLNEDRPDIPIEEELRRLKPWLRDVLTAPLLPGIMPPGQNSLLIRFKDGLLSSEADTTLGAIWALIDLPDTTAVDSIECLQDMALDYNYVKGELHLLFWSGLDDLRRHVESGKQQLFKLPQGAKLRFLQASDYAGNLMQVTLRTPDSVVALPLTRGSR